MHILDLLSSILFRYFAIGWYARESPRSRACWAILFASLIAWPLFLLLMIFDGGPHKALVGIARELDEKAVASRNR